MNPIVRDLFHQLADLSPEERRSMLAKQTVPLELRSELESLLSFDSTEDQTEMYWGPYRRIRLLGAGGMATVYLAERADGEVRQKVAVKVLRSDIQRPAWRERFLRERQVLADLNHASIARLIDAGTKDGLPYLVMEYVDGLPIDEYAANLSIEEKLVLFLYVCDGVSHAHQRLVVHRDIKPSNILVDSAGHPKLLDFGIAKLLDDTAERTLTSDRLLTPIYASPEQLRGIADTTATDVYSLGAVLHKLLTGFAPSEQGHARPVLPADLEYILRKALRPEPKERYLSVEAFANDVRAFLESNPVQARSGDRWYRTRKFVRRYWIPVSAAILVIAALSSALVLVNRERRIAERRFEQVRQLSNKILDLDNTLRGLPGSTKTRNELVAMTNQYLQALIAEEPRGKDMTMEVADAFYKLAEVQGVPITNNLGQYAQAEQTLIQSDRLVQQVLSAAPTERHALLRSAEVNEARMILSDALHHRQDVPHFAQEAVKRMDALAAAGPLSESEALTSARVFNNISLAYKNLHRYRESIEYGRKSLAVGASAGPRRPGQIANTMSVIADSLRYSGDLDGALKMITDARSVEEKGEDGSAEPLRASDLANIIWRQAMILGADGQISLMQRDEALVKFQEVLAILEKVAELDSSTTEFRMLFIQSGREFGLLLRHDHPDRSLDVFDRAISQIRKVKNNAKASRGEAQLLALSAYPLRKLKRNGEAAERIQKAFELLRQTKSYPVNTINTDDEAFSIVKAEADHLSETGEPQKAAELYRDLLDKVMASKPDPENDLRHASALSQIYEALAMSEARLKIWTTWNRKLPDNTFIRRQLALASAS